MSGSEWVFVCLLTYFLRSSVSEEKTLNVRSGDNVILQCQGPRDADMLEWIKPDMKSEEYVFFLRENRSYEEYQHQRFHGRVELVDREMKDGNYSVILKNVNIDDSGPYECHVGKTNSHRRKKETPKFINRVTVNVDSVWKDIKARTRDNVTLPCQALSNIPITTVKWTIREKKDYVFFYRNRRFVPGNQHPVYKNWVELKDGKMQDEDASLILKDVMNFDSGIYECWVNQKKTSIIDLYVYPSQGGGAGHTEDGGNKDGHVGLAVVLSVAVVAVVVVGGFLLLRKCFNPHGNKPKLSADGQSVQQLV